MEEELRMEARRRDREAARARAAVHRSFFFPELFFDLFDVFF